MKLKTWNWFWLSEKQFFEKKVDKAEKRNGEDEQIEDRTTNQQKDVFGVVIFIFTHVDSSKSLERAYLSSIVSLKVTKD